jgi:hypothetical protein
VRRGERFPPFARRDARPLRRGRLGPVVDFAHAFATAAVGGVRYWLVERDDQPAPADTARRSADFLEGLRF